MSSGGSIVQGAPGPNPVQQGNYGELGLLASTGVNGFPLVNGTPGIFSWTAPNDGQLHRVVTISGKNVTSTETGGQINFSISGPGFPLVAQALITGSQTGPFYRPQQSAITSAAIVPPGCTVTISQGSALTAGASTFYCELWGS